MLTKLQQLKINLQVLMDNFDEYKEPFFTSLEISENGSFYDISQNDYSLLLLFSSLFYKDAISCFFLELLNFYQKLESKNFFTTIPYLSYSQAITTYGLKCLARHHLIEILFCYQDNSYDLENYESLFGVYHKKEVAMYTVSFYKLRNIMEKDLPLIASLAKGLQVDFSQFETYSVNEVLFFRLKKEAMLKNIFSSSIFEKVNTRKEPLFSILDSITDEIFHNVLDKNSMVKRRNFKKNN